MSFSSGCIPIIVPKWWKPTARSTTVEGRRTILDEMTRPRIRAAVAEATRP